MLLQRTHFALLALFAAAALSACTVETKDDDKSAAGAAGSTGTAGTAGSNNGGSSGSAGSAGSANDPCKGIPTTGNCIEGNKIEVCRTPPPGEDGSQAAPEIITTDCAAGTMCTLNEAGEAECKLTTACAPAAKLCGGGDGNSLLTCKADGSGYDEAACGTGEKCITPPGEEPLCVAFAGAAQDENTLSGCVTFERRGIDKDNGPSADLKVDQAWLQFIAIYNGDTYIGNAVTDPGGCFVANLTEPASATTIVYLYTMDFAAGSESPLIGVVKNTDPKIETLESNEYWFWSNQGDANCQMAPAPVVPDAEGPGKATLSPWTITEACGSGAIRVFQWIRYGMWRLGDSEYGIATTKDKPQDTVAVFWSPGVDSACGACFLNKAFGGAKVNIPGGYQDRYDTAMQISGSDGNPTHWSYSVLSHETGHWVMANYSKSPGEGGPHYVKQSSKPGLAYSEGFATAFGQWNVSDPSADPPDYDPIYIDTQDFVTFWVDIEKADTSNGNLDLPDPNGTIDQLINENVVSGMLWHLWNPQGKQDGAYQNLGDEKIFAAFQDSRLFDKNRGYEKVDLVDFFDATLCTNNATPENVQAVSTQFQFPWDSSPLCQ